MIYYYGFLVNVGIGLILVIHLLLVYYIVRMSTQPLLLYDPLLFLLLYLNHFMLYKKNTIVSFKHTAFLILMREFVRVVLADNVAKDLNIWQNFD